MSTNNESEINDRAYRLRTFDKGRLRRLLLRANRRLGVGREGEEGNEWVQTDGRLEVQ